MLGLGADAVAPCLHPYAPVYSSPRASGVLVGEKLGKNRVEQQLPFHTVGSFIKLRLLLFLTSFVRGLMS